MCALVSQNDSLQFGLLEDESTKMNKIRVSWTDSSPDVAACPADCSSGTSSCVCPISVELQAVFAAWHVLTTYLRFPEP